jgi:hypothetical protein
MTALVVNYKWIQATSREVAGSIPDEVIEFFNWSILPAALSPSDRLSLLTEVSTRNLPGRKGRPAHEAGNHTAICESIVQQMWEPRRSVTGIAFVVSLCWVCFAAAAVRRRWMQLRPSSDDDCDNSSAWGGRRYLVSAHFPRCCRSDRLGR